MDATTVSAPCVTNGEHSDDLSHAAELANGTGRHAMTTGVDRSEGRRLFALAASDAPWATANRTQVLVPPTAPFADGAYTILNFDAPAEAALIVWLRNHAAQLLADEGLDAAWRAAEGALPKNYDLGVRRFPDGQGYAWASGFLGKPPVYIEAHADLPTVALRTLVVRLAEATR